MIQLVTELIFGVAAMLLLALGFISWVLAGSRYADLVPYVRWTAGFLVLAMWLVPWGLNVNGVIERDIALRFYITGLVLLPYNLIMGIKQLPLGIDSPPKRNE